MAASTLDGIRAGLAAAIKAVITDAQCTGYLLANPTGPGFEIEPGEVQYDQAMGRASDEWTIIVRGYVSDGSDVNAQKKLDAWLAPSGAMSVKAAIEADRTLGGAVQTLRVTQMSGYRRYGAKNSQATYLGAEWTVRLFGSGV